jgi:hypothetical protein
MLPWIVKLVMLWLFQKRQILWLWSQGMARHSKDEVETLICEWVKGVYNIFPLFC